MTRSTVNMMTEITALQTEGPTAAEVDKVREAQRRSRETAIRQNGFWMSNLSAVLPADPPGGSPSPSAREIRLRTNVSTSTESTAKRSLY